MLRSRLVISTFLTVKSHAALVPTGRVEPLSASGAAARSTAQVGESFAEGAPLLPERRKAEDRRKRRGKRRDDT